MGTWHDKLVRFLRAEDGPTSVEYAVMLALILMVCFASIGSLGASVNNMLTAATNVPGSSGS
jgi:pilus assembly protein Flp/PilA